MWNAVGSEYMGKFVKKFPFSDNMVTTDINTQSRPRVMGKIQQ